MVTKKQSKYAAVSTIIQQCLLQVRGVKYAAKKTKQAAARKMSVGAKVTILWELGSNRGLN